MCSVAHASHSEYQRLATHTLVTKRVNVLCRQFFFSSFPSLSEFFFFMQQTFLSSVTYVTTIVHLFFSTSERVSVASISLAFISAVTSVLGDIISLFLLFMNACLNLHPFFFFLSLTPASFSKHFFSQQSSVSAYFHLFLSCSLAVCLFACSFVCCVEAR